MLKCTFLIQLHFIQPLRSIVLVSFIRDPKIFPIDIDNIRPVENEFPSCYRGLTLCDMVNGKKYPELMFHGVGVYKISDMKVYKLYSEYIKDYFLGIVIKAKLSENVWGETPDEVTIEVETTVENGELKAKSKFPLTKDQIYIINLRKCDIESLKRELQVETVYNGYNVCADAIIPYKESPYELAYFSMHRRKTGFTVSELKEIFSKMKKVNDEYVCEGDERFYWQYWWLLPENQINDEEQP